MRLAAPHAPRVHEVDSLSLPLSDAEHSRLPAPARYGVSVAGLSGSGTGVGSGVAVDTGVGSGSGVGIGGGVAKIPSGSRSRRYISQVPLPSGGSGKQTHAHFSGKHSLSICGFFTRASGEQ
jgi:hypothetical protein